jgi:hypothetical protein
VVGPTLGADGTFVINNNLGINGAPNSDSFSFTVSGYTMAANSTVSFNYEIFPDASCTALTAGACGGNAVGGYYPNQPDIDVSVGSTQIFQAYGTVPSGGGDPQALGFASVVVAGAVNPVFTFSDWPAEIGFDNFTITPPVQGQSAVPEPASLVLLGSGLIAAASRRRRRRLPTAPPVS